MRPSAEKRRERQAASIRALPMDDEEPGPYAKAFREKFPVPEFPGIKNRQEDQA